MATDVLSTTPSVATVAGLVAAGLGAVLAYTQLATGKDKETRPDTRVEEGTSKEEEKRATRASESTAQKGRRRKKAKAVSGPGEGGAVRDHCGEDKAQDGGGPADADRHKGKGKDQDKGDVQAGVVPGAFDAVSARAKIDADADGGSRGASPASKAGNSGKRGKRKKKSQQGKVQGGDGERGEDKGKGRERDGADEVGSEGSETGREGTTAAHGLRHSGESTDADASMFLSPSMLASGQLGKGNVRASTRLVPPSQPQVQARAPATSQPRALRPSLSFDTDSSWTHVDHHRLKTSRSVDGQTGRFVDAVDVASSDLASTESSSPVAERSERSEVVTDTIRSTRADLAQHTLADKLAPRSEKTGVEDMLEQPDFPTIARVMRVQPRADESPVPGFSWEDYGDVIEDSILVHDADQEDEGEWGIVKSRNRTRTPQTATTTIDSVAQTTPTPETMTKRQRQNARKRELTKSIKAETEATRLEGLAKHKRELERLRIIEQSRQGGGKQSSGGMQATVDDRGKLVWE